MSAPATIQDRARNWFRAFSRESCVDEGGSLFFKATYEPSREAPDQTGKVRSLIPEAFRGFFQLSQVDAYGGKIRVKVTFDESAKPSSVARAAASVLAVSTAPSVSKAAASVPIAAVAPIRLALAPITYPYRAKYAMTIAQLRELARTWFTTKFQAEHTVEGSKEPIRDLCITLPSNKNGSFRPSFDPSILAYSTRVCQKLKDQNLNKNSSFLFDA